MKHNICLVAVGLTIVAVLSSCGGGNQTTEPVEEIDPATTAIQELTKDDKIPYETTKQIREDIERALFDIGAVTDSMTLYVMDGNESDSISILISWSGMALEVQFPDYVNASVIHTKEVAQKYNLTVSDIDVGFSRGEGEAVTWHSTDGVSGTLFDSYGADSMSAVSFENQTLGDLIARYGCTNEFYDLSEYEEQE